MTSFQLVKIIIEDGETTYMPTMFGYTVLILAMLLALLLGCLKFGNKKKIGVKQLSYSAMCIALAFVTSFIKVIQMPMGGSVTLLSMFFITYIGYMFGPYAGFFTAIAYGFLQLIADPYIISIPQMLTDYIFAFGALGISGFFSKSHSKYAIIISYLAGTLGRYFFAFLSGLIFFGSFIPEGFSNAAIYSLAYNGAYIGAEAAITVFILCIPSVRKALNKMKIRENS